MKKRIIGIRMPSTFSLKKERCSLETADMSKDEHTPEFKSFLERAKKRQETFHWRLKSFNILGGRFE